MRATLFILLSALSAMGFLACRAGCQPEQQRVNAALAAMQQNRRAGAALEQSIVELQNRIQQCEKTQRDRHSCTSPAVHDEYRTLKAMHRDTEQRADKLMNDYEQALSKLTICKRSD